MNVTDSAEPRPRPKNARRISRELAVQTLYAWLINPREAMEIKRDARLDERFPKADAALYDRIVDGVLSHSEGLRQSLAPLLDRKVESLSPVEHAILLMGALEMSAHVETPYRVIINEAVELAKTFGGTDGHKYINGVLDRLAAEIRPDEARRR